MRATPADAKREASIIESLEVGLQWHEAQAALFREARERMRLAAARLKLAELEP